MARVQKSAIFPRVQNSPRNKWFCAPIGSGLAGCPMKSVASPRGPNGTNIMQPIKHDPPKIGYSIREACQASSLRSEEHTSELQSLMRISYAVFCLKKKTTNTDQIHKIAEPER